MKEEKIAKAAELAPKTQPAKVSTVKIKPAAAKSPITLAVDIGGTGIKAAALDQNGKMVSERQKIKTPKNATPKKVIATIAIAAKPAIIAMRPNVIAPAQNAKAGKVENARPVGQAMIGEFLFVGLEQWTHVGRNAGKGVRR